jgi:hypothetical protein
MPGAPPTEQNGGVVFEGSEVTWTQNPQDVTIQVPYLETTKPLVEWAKDRLVVATQSATIFEAKLPAEVDVEGCTFTISDGVLSLEMKKKAVAWWSSAVEEGNPLVLIRATLAIFNLFELLLGQFKWAMQRHDRSRFPT